VTEKQFLLIVNCLVLNIVAVSSFLRVPVKQFIETLHPGLALNSASLLAPPCPSWQGVKTALSISHPSTLASGSHRLKHCWFTE